MVNGRFIIIMVRASTVYLIKCKQVNFGIAITSKTVQIRTKQSLLARTLVHLLMFAL